MMELVVGPLGVELGVDRFRLELLCSSLCPPGRPPKMMTQCPDLLQLSVPVPAHRGGAWFESAEEFASILNDPSRVVRLEWRRLRRIEHGRLTSHSMLLARLLGGARVRLERFVDIGVTESITE